MSELTDLLTGVAGLLSSGNAAVYNSSGEYTDQETLPAVTMMDMPADPDRVITLYAVPLTDDVAQPMGKVLIQLAMRGAPGTPLDVEEIGDAAKAVLHGLTNLTLGSVKVIQLLRHGSVPMGEDANLRWLRTDHYYADLYYPATAAQPDGGWD